MSSEEIWKTIYNSKDLKSFDYQNQLKRAKLNSGHAGSLWIIPNDEIVFEQVPKDIPAFLSKTEKGEIDGQPGFLRDSIQLLRNDATRINRKYKEFSEYPKNHLDFSQIPKYSYDIDCEDSDDENGTTDTPSSDSANTQRPLAAEVFNNTGRRKSYVNTDILDFENVSLALKTKPEWKLLSKEHKITFSHTSRMPLGKIYGEKSQEAVSKDQHKGRRRTVAIDDITFEWELGTPMKLIGEFAFFDFKEKRKVSESKWFEIPAGDKKHRAPFSLSFTTTFNADIVLCFRLHKPFQGDVGTWLDLCQKGKDCTEKMNPTYVQAFGWWSTTVYSETTTTGDLILDTLKVNNESMNRFDESKYNEIDFYALLGSVKSKNQNGNKKPKVIPIKISYVIKELGKSSKQNINFQHLNELVVPDSVAVHGVSPSHLLYIHPLALNFYRTNSNWKNISIKMQVCRTDKLDATDRLLKCIEMPNGSLSDEWNSSIQYHNRSPCYMEEVKIHLPIVLNSVHIFFTFSQISFTNQREDKVIGYAHFKLIDENGCFVNDLPHEVPIFQNLVDSYTIADAESTKILDSGKSVVNFRTQLSSALYTCQPLLSQFFQLTDLGYSKNLEDSNVLSRLTEISARDLSNFLPTIFNRLLNLICSADNSDVSSKKAIIAIGDISDLLETTANGSKPAVIEKYLQECFTQRTSWVKHLHCEVVRLWIQIIRENNQAIKTLFKMSWVLFDLIWKSILETRKDNNQSVTATFIEDLKTLRQELSNEIYRSAKAGYNIAKVLNINIAKFLSSLICCVNPNVIFVEIIEHVDSFNNDLPVATYLKFDFLQEICLYELSIQYSVPLSHLEGKDQPKRLVTEFRRFFFANVVSKEVIKSLESANVEIRQKASKSLKCILEKYESDSRFTESEKSLIFSMFLPLLTAIAEICTDETKQLSKDLESSRDLCVIVLYILRYAVRDLTVKWIYEYNPKAIFNLISGVSKHFIYPGQAKIAENLVKGIASAPGVNTDAAKKFIENSYKSRPGTVTANGNLREIRGEKQHRAQTARAASRSVSGKTADSNEFMSFAKNEIMAVSLQSNEATFVALEILYSLSEQLKLINSQIMFGLFFGALRDVLNCPQNNISGIHCLKFMGNIIQQHSSCVLKENKICSDTCNLLLPYCGSNFGTVRELAAEALYILMRNNFLDTKKNIGKVKVQLTVALSQQETTNPLNLKLGLTYINALATVETAFASSFGKLVQDTVNRLISIMMDNLRINKHREDPEMMIDMYASLANNYRGAPDLRLAVLDTMSELHAKLNNHAEAGFCKLHAAALVSEYLKFKRSTYGGPLGAADFIFCSQNILEEPAMETDIDPEFEGICQSPAFSEVGIVEMIEKAIVFLKKAQHHETVIECYKLIIPIFEKKFNYNHLIRCYGAIKESFEDIVSSTGKRIVGTYFRVTFAGSKFGAQNGKQYIYKERGVTQLSEIVTRLTDIYKTRFGNDFEFVLDSAKEKQKEDKAYVSISFCEPYFNDSEADQQSNNVSRKLFPLNKFFFDTPFTASGKAHGEVDTQQKRKYIMQVERPFPFITKRIQVVTTKEIILSPIEVSIETVADRCDKLRTAVKAPSPNLKSIQLLLQGAVRPQVNKGPLEIAQVFLDEKAIDKHPSKFVTELKSQLSNLISLCEQALKFSQMHSPEDQRDYNEDLAAGFTSLKTKMNQLIAGGSQRPPSDPALNFIKDNTKLLFPEQDHTSKVLANFLAS